MELTVEDGKEVEVVDERAAPSERTRKPASPNIDAMRRQRIRWDGYFSGPTW